MERNLIIFASAPVLTGGTGAENLARKLSGTNIAFVSNHKQGGVMARAEALGVPFYYFPGPYTAEGYRELVQEISENMHVDVSDWWYALSGWFQRVYGLNSARTFNIHPAPLPRFAGMYGEKLHLAVWGAYQKGEITEGEIVMHFVTEEYDKGPIFFRIPLPLRGIKDYEAYREIVRIHEHNFQPRLAELVMQGDISWDGNNPESLRV